MYEINIIQIGDVKDQKCNGYGRIYYPNGDIYYGNFKNDEKEGDGCYVYCNGDQYKGEYKCNV